MVRVPLVSVGALPQPAVTAASAGPAVTVARAAATASTAAATPPASLRMDITIPRFRRRANWWTVTEPPRLRPCGRRAPGTSAALPGRAGGGGGRPSAGALEAELGVAAG